MYEGRTLRAARDGAGVLLENRRDDLRCFVQADRTEEATADLLAKVREEVR